MARNQPMSLCNLVEVFGEHPIEPLMEEIATHDKGCLVYETYNPDDCDCSLAGDWEDDYGAMR